jgi:hypothetical protein
MKGLFVLFLVAIMLTGSNLRSIVNQNIEGQHVPIPQQPQQVKEKTEEESKVNVEEITNFINRHNSSMRRYWNDYIRGRENDPWDTWGRENDPWGPWTNHMRKY